MRKEFIKDTKVRELVYRRMVHIKINMNIDTK